MKLLNCVIGSALALALTSAHAGTALSDAHPEEAYADNLPSLVTSPGPYAPLIKDVQQKLHDLGFDAGPVNGEFGTKTQAALAQFQLAQTLPASGALDDETLQALGVARNAAAAEPPEEQAAQAPSDSRSAASGSTSQD
jgi:peptidoglycan hydrolase-like protein with peptidoglycan-binding domain